MHVLRIIRKEISHVSLVRVLPDFKVDGQTAVWLV